MTRPSAGGKKRGKGPVTPRGCEYRVTAILRGASRKDADRWFNAMLVPMRRADGTAVAFVTGAAIKVARRAGARGGKGRK